MSEERAQSLAEKLFEGLAAQGQRFVKEVGAELMHKAAHGAHEGAAALFNGSAFVMYPRGQHDDHGMEGHGVHGKDEPAQDQPGMDGPQQEHQHGRGR